MSLRQAAEEFSNRVISRRVASRFVAKDLSKEQKEFFQASQKAEKTIKGMDRLTKQLRNAEPDKAKGLYGKLIDQAVTLIDEAVAVHKKLQPLKSRHADAEFKVMGASILKLEHTLAKNKDSSLPAFSASQVYQAAELLFGDISRVSALAIAGGL